MAIAEQIRADLFAAADDGYKAFHAKLVPTIDPARIIGVRMPAQRAIAKAYRGDVHLADYLALTHHDYVEEINVHGFLISALKDFADTLHKTNAFLPQLDNWANCDSFSPQAFKRNPVRLRAEVPAWLADSAHPYTVRFGINMLMQHCLGDHFNPADLAAVSACACDHYYVNMGIAWYMSMALAKQWDHALPWIANHRLPNSIHRKTIQKAIESRQVPDERKVLLKTYR